MEEKAVKPVGEADRKALESELQRFIQRYSDDGLKPTPAEFRQIIQESVKEMAKLRETGYSGTVKQGLTAALYDFVQKKGDQKLGERLYLELELHNAGVTAAETEKQMRDIETKQMDTWLKSRGLNRFRLEGFSEEGKKAIMDEFRAYLKENDSKYKEAAFIHEDALRIFEEFRKAIEGAKG